MDAALNRKSLMLGVPGIILQFVGQFLPAMVSGRQVPSDSVVIGGVCVVLLGTVLLIFGLCTYAQAKGHSRWWGLMGLLSIIGLIVLGLLKDRRKESSPPQWM